MKNNLTKIIKIKGKFLSIIFIVLALDYVLLFMLETILPGLVMKVFNLNILLLIILILWLFLIFIEDKQLKFKTNKLFVITSLLIFILILVSLFFSLYKIDYLVTIIYITLTIISGKLLFDLWQKE